MGVKNDRVRRARNFPFAVNGGWSVFGFSFEQLGFQSAALHHLENKLGIATDVRRVRSDVGNSEQARELVDDRSFVRAPIVADC